MKEDKLEEFLDKIDHLCFEYQYEIQATRAYSGKEVLIIIDEDKNVIQELLYIDGDGRGK